MQENTNKSDPPNSNCPCQSGNKYSDCCGQYISGKAHAPTAEALMRARYTAYALGEIDYLPKTLPLIDRKSFDWKGAKEWSRQSQWLGLELISAKDTVPNSKASVEFKAKFKIGDQELEHHEICRFEKQMGRWFLIDGKIIEKQN